MCHNTCTQTFLSSSCPTILISKQTTPLLLFQTLQFPLFLMSLCESYLPSRECMNEVSECCRVALKNSGGLFICFVIPSPFDSGLDWSQFNATGLVGKKWVRRKFSKLGLRIVDFLSCFGGNILWGVDAGEKNGDIKMSQFVVDVKRHAIELVSGFSLLVLLCLSIV